MAAAKITTKGQVTIPKSVRDRLHLEAGDRLEFRFDDHGRLVVEPVVAESLGRVFGLLDHLIPDEPVTVDEMKRAVRERATQRFRRSS
jgi:AbrB family looped-hinge helix DNA binding protein